VLWSGRLLGECVCGMHAVEQVEALRLASQGVTPSVWRGNKPYAGAVRSTQRATRITPSVTSNTPMT
jgi:hypothetical protein